MAAVFGKRVGRYTLLEQLGVGGMATVYNAFDTRMERNVALKIILPTRQSSKIFLTRFLTEARALSQLSHTNIVKVLDYGEENGLPYLVMDFIAGGTLRDQMNAPINWAEAAAILAPIARALEYVHKQRIVHRDVKPSNILIDEKGQPMLSDFGIIKLIEEHEQQDMTGTGVGVGTPDYMSPEQGTGRPVDFHADIYALGVVFFELVTGRKPYQAETPMGVVIKHVREPMPKPRRYTRDLPFIVQEVILKATAKRPASRFHTMGDFAEALELLAAGKHVDTARIHQITGKKRIRIAPIFSIFVITLFALAAGYYFVFSRATMFTTTLTPTSQAGVASATQQSTPTQTFTIVAELPTPTMIATPIPTIAKVKITATQVVFPVLLDEQTLPDTMQLSPENVNGINQVALWGIGRSSSIAWSSDQRSIAVGTSVGLYIYDANTLERRRFIDTSGWVTRVLFSPDSKYVVTGLKPFNPTTAKTEITLRIWNVETGEPAFDGYSMQVPQKFNDATGSINPEVTSLAFVDSGRYLAIGFSNGVLNLLDVNYANESTKLLSAMVQFQTVSSLDFSHDNRLLASGGQGEIYIWDINTGQSLTRILQHGLVTGLRFSMADDYLISSGDDRVVRNYRMLDNQLRDTYTAKAPIEDLGISPDGSAIAIVDSQGTLTQLSTDSYQPLFEISVDKNRAMGVVYSADSTRMAVTSWNEALRIVDTAEGQTLTRLEQTQNSIEKLEFSNNGKWLAVLRANNRVDIWNVDQARIQGRFDGHIPNGIAFSPDSKYVLITNGSAQGWDDKGQITIIDIETGNPIQTLVGYKPGWFVSFSPDQTLLVSGDTQTAHVWDVNTYLPLLLHGGHNAGCGVYYTPDNQVLATISDAGIHFNADQNIIRLCAARDAGKVQIMGISPDQKYAALKPQIGGIFPWYIGAVLDPQHYRFETDRSDFLGYSPNSKFAFVGSLAKDELWIGRVSGMQALWRLKLFSAYDYRIATSMTARWIAIGANDGAIRLYGIRK